jgi:hypothetical protein
MFKFAKPHKTLIVIIAALSALIVGQFAPSGHAVHLTNHSVRVSSALVNATVSHNFQFTYPSTNNVGSIAFEYCSNGALTVLPCTTPAGLNVSGATLINQTGNTGFTIDGVNSTTSKIVLTRASAPAASVASTYDFNNIVNPATANATTYVRITTYPTTDGSGAYNDDGGVAFATVNPFEVGAFVPPFIKLCVGITVAADCSSFSGSSIDLGVLSPNSTKYGTSELSAGTNSITGYNIFSLGTTMTSGNNIISAMNPAATSKRGINQFGFNLRANTSPALGQDPQGGGTATPQAGYNTTNVFKFQNGDNIASASLPTDYSKMTVSYVVNIDPDRPPGVYATTITYLAVGQF